MTAANLNLMSSMESQMSRFSSVADSFLQQMDSIVDFIIDMRATHSTDCEFVPESNRMKDISTKFTLLNELGIGATARVFLAQDKETNEYYALKQLSKFEKNSIKLFKIEYNMLNKVCNPICHSHIPQLIGLPYIDDYNYYILTEYCCGGRLLDYIARDLGENFTELNACKYIKTMLDIVKFIHDKGIAHRDIKPANLLFDKKPTLHLYNDFNNSNNNKNMLSNQNASEEAKLMLIDFGLAIECKDDDKNNDFVGTLVYMPPKSVRERKGWELKKGDIWSIGIVSYILVCGNAPFVGENQALILKEIIEADLKWPQNIKLSNLCKAFISKLLQKEPKDRYSAAEALKDPWFELLRVDDTSDVGMEKNNVNVEKSMDMGITSKNNNVKNSKEDSINGNGRDDEKTESETLTDSNTNNGNKLTKMENVANRKLGSSYHQSLNEFKQKTVSLDYLIINASLSSVGSQERNKMASPSLCNIDVANVDNHGNDIDTKDFANVKENTVHKYLCEKGLNKEDAQKRANGLVKIIAAKPMYGRVGLRIKSLGQKSLRKTRTLSPSGRSELGIGSLVGGGHSSVPLVVYQHSKLEDIDENIDYYDDQTTNEPRTPQPQPQPQPQQQQQLKLDPKATYPGSVNSAVKIEKLTNTTQTTSDKNFGDFMREQANGGDGDGEHDDGNELRIEVDHDATIIFSPKERNDSSSTTIVGELEDTDMNRHNNPSTVSAHVLSMKRVDSESDSKKTTLKSAPRTTNERSIEIVTDGNVSNNNKKKSLFGSFCAAFCCC